MIDVKEILGNSMFSTFVSNSFIIHVFVVPLSAFSARIPNLFGLLAGRNKVRLSVLFRVLMSLNR